MEALAVRCPFCNGNEVSQSVTGTERFFGTGGSFEYSVCATCGSIYLNDPSLDLSPHYPEHYYSYTGGKRPPLQAAVEDFVCRQRARFVVAVSRRAGVRLDHDSRVMDVGSGAGDLLRAFRSIGYSDVVGVDPFLREGVDTAGVPVERRTLDEVANDSGFAGKATTVMFHHSLEHVFDPAASLEAAKRLLCPGGGIVVRVPVVSYAWERYGTYWVGFDAPRHVALPTERGMYELAARLGLRVAFVRYDSTENQFVVSNAYLKGRTQLEAFPSCPPRTAVRKLTTIPLRLRAAWLNAQKRGDQAAFVLLPAPEGMKEEP